MNSIFSYAIILTLLKLFHILQKLFHFSTGTEWVQKEKGSLNKLNKLNNGNNINKIDMKFLPHLPLI